MATKKVYQKLIWKIKEFPEKIKQYGNEERLESPITEIIIDGKETKWKLNLSPNGDKKEYKGFVGLYLWCLTKDECYDTVVRLGVCGGNSKGKEFNRSKEEWKESPQGWGFTKMISHEDLNGDYLKSGSLTVFCELDISLPTTNDEQPAMEPPNNAKGKFASFLQDDKLNDCELHASDGTAFKSHKVVLAAMSPIFKEIFTADTPEAEANVLKLEDIDSTTLKLLLHFCYCDEVDDEDLDENALDLLVAANKFQIKELVEVCVKSLIEDLDEENVLKVLPVATKLGGTSALFSECMDVLVSNYDDLIETPEWKELPPTTTQKIIEHLIHHKNEIQEVEIHRFTTA